MGLSRKLQFLEFLPIVPTYLFISKNTRGKIILNCLISDQEFYFLMECYTSNLYTVKAMLAFKGQRTCLIFPYRNYILQNQN